jgi:DNA mismatch repair protein MutS
MSAREYRDTVIFLRRVEEGPADRSYGIQVARLAGLPADVITRAREILGNLERNEFGRDGMPSLARKHGAGNRTVQPPLFVPASEAPASPILAEIDALEPDRLTPLEALALLSRWKASTKPRP